MSIGKILIVDDDKELANTMLGIAEQIDIEAVVCYDATGAVEVVNSSHVDVVISDLSMPEISGIQLLENLNSLNFYLPFIVVTGYADKKKAIEALRLGAYDFLEKPLKLDEIISMMRNSLDYSLKVQEYMKSLISSVPNEVEIDINTLSKIAKVKANQKKAG